LNELNNSGRLFILEQGDNRKVLKKILLVAELNMVLTFFFQLPEIGLPQRGC
jgi:hypothetical protein